jgi:hypothetical protein
MHSSTSASDPRRATRAILLLLAGVVAWFALLEVGMRLALPRLSETQRRMEADAAAAFRLGPLAADGAHTVLIIGNSLLEQGIRRQQLQDALSPAYAVAYYPIEDTTYLDWLYGLRRLFADGSRPDTVVLCMSGRQLLSNSTYGEISARRLLQPGDLPRLVHDARLDMMTASAYLFATKSAWLGNRSFLRLGLLQKWLPRSDLLAAHLTGVDPLPLVVNEETLARAMSRLAALQALAREHGVRFVYLVPPSLNRADIGAALAERARSSGIPVLLTYAPAEMPRQNFADGLHLNPTGAAEFTARVGPALREVLKAAAAPGMTPPAPAH